jgi:hypothetical protein
LELGTHSIRRGLSSDWALRGVPERSRREHGRWRSKKVADGYIDANINIQLLLHSLSKAFQIIFAVNMAAGAVRK